MGGCTSEPYPESRPGPEPFVLVQGCQLALKDIERFPDQEWYLRLRKCPPKPFFLKSDEVDQYAFEFHFYMEMKAFLERAKLHDELNAFITHTADPREWTRMKIGAVSKAEWAAWMPEKASAAEVVRAVRQVIKNVAPVHYLLGGDYEMKHALRNIAVDIALREQAIRALREQAVLAERRQQFGSLLDHLPVRPPLVEMKAPYQTQDGSAAPAPAPTATVGAAIAELAAVAAARPAPSAPAAELMAADSWSRLSDPPVTVRDIAVDDPRSLLNTLN